MKQGSTALYYSADWQVLEERDGSGIARVSMVWSPVYIDAMIARDRDADTNGSLEERLYVAHDANFNVSSIINTSGSAVERFLLDPYGSPTFLNGSWSVIGSSAYAWTHLHQGGRQSSASSLYHFRHRDLSPHLGRWVMNDPIGFAAGASLISYLHQSPLVNSDPLGLCPRCGPVAVMMGNDGETKSEVGKTKRRRVWRPGMGDTCCKYTDGKYLEWNLADCSRFNNPVHCCAALNPAPGWRSLGPVSMSECPAAKCKDPYHMAPGEPPGQDVLRCMDECDTLYRELQAKRILDGKLFEIPGAHACMSVCYAECFNHGGDFKKAAQAVKDCLWAIEQIKKILEKVKIFD